jgi:bifunctional UDP-N-acetylglucosamine pyrophosphorylase/glucosamine-1-phosphate N-acetyltransferase
MQAVILAAGESSRFFPLNLKHKCLVKIAGEPIISHTLRSVKRAGITDVIIVRGKNSEIEDALGNGKKFGIKIRYVIQPEPTGAGDAVLIASRLITSDFYLINSNHAEFDQLKRVIDTKRKTNKDPILLGAPGSTKKKFGALKISGDRVLAVSEKPRSAKNFSNLRIVGVYFLNQDFIDTLKKTPSTHYSLEDALDRHAKEKRLLVAKTSYEILSLKYPWDLLKLKSYILKKQLRHISKKASIKKSAQIEGNVVIEEGVNILENAVIKGPCYIGRNVFVGSNTLIRDGSNIEENCVIGAYMEVKNSLILENSKTHSGFIGDSIIGPNTKIGALFSSANVRLDRTNVKSVVKEEKIDTGLRFFGTVIGENVVIGERVSTMPGVIIGNNSSIGPSTTVMHNVGSDTAFYTKFAEYVEKKRLPALRAVPPKKI